MVRRGHPLSRGLKHLLLPLLMMLNFFGPEGTSPKKGTETIAQLSTTSKVCPEGTSPKKGTETFI